MHRPRKLLFVLTDGGHARLVEHSSTSSHFSTTMKLDHTKQLQTLRDELRATSPGRSFESTSSTRHAVEPKSDRVQLEKEAFIAEVAERAADVVERLGLHGVFLAAPAGLIGALQERLEQRTTVVGRLVKDLTKVPDHDLHAWLDESLYAP